MKVAFYLNNGDYSSNHDFSMVMNGNPGIGGSEYMVLLISYLMSVRDNGLIVRLYAAKDSKFSPEVDTVIEPVMDVAARHAAADGFTRFVFDHKRVRWFEKPFQGLPPQMKLIPWCHCFTFTRELHVMYAHPNMGRIVYVSKEQMDLMRDDRSFCISDYIFNTIRLSEIWVSKACQKPNSKRGHVVVYMGSLVPLKTFHVLAEIWSLILSKVPDAELYIIGSGKVYGDGVKLGKHGIAEESYENLFLPYLMKDGELLPGIHFMGTMGEDKNEVLVNAKVGVPNPTGRSETFCLCAVEMQAMGCSVAVMRAPGYFDTIYNGVVVKNKHKLALSIIRLLLGDAPKSFDDTLDYIRTNFSTDVIARNWEVLLRSDLNGYLHPISTISHLSYRHKWMKEVLRRLKQCIPVLYRLHPTVESVYNKMTRNPYAKLTYHP